MERPMTQVVVAAGLVDEEMLAQLKRWKMISDEEIESFAETTLNTPTSIVQKIHEALEDEELVAVRDTDLDTADLWLRTRQKAKLHVPNPDDPDKTIGIPVEYCQNRLGEYIIPWMSESIRDLMVNESTYLKPLGKARVYFSDSRELFYASNKAFIVCTAAKE